MVINIKTYKNNKEIIKNLNNINAYFWEAYPNKTWGWVGLTVLLYSQLAIETYLKEDNPDAEAYPALKSMLWNFQNKVNEIQKTKGVNSHE